MADTDEDNMTIQSTSLPSLSGTSGFSWLRPSRAARFMIAGIVVLAVSMTRLLVVVKDWTRLLTPPVSWPAIGCGSPCWLSVSRWWSAGSCRVGGAEPVLRQRDLVSAESLFDPERGMRSEESGSALRQIE